MGGGFSFLNVGELLSNLATIVGILFLLVVAAVGMLWLFWLLRRYQYRHRKENRAAVPLKSVSKAVPSYRSILPQLEKEISRARRSERPMTLVAIRPMTTVAEWEQNAGTVAEDGRSGSDPSRLDPIEFIFCGCAFRDALREIDISAYDGAHNLFVVALPESTKEQALLAVDRLNDIIGDRIAKQLQVGVAQFPVDGLIIEDLVKCAAEPASLESSMPSRIRNRYATPAYQGSIGSAAEYK